VKNILRGCALWAFLCVFLGSFPVYAAHETKRLTDNNIREFVMDVTRKANEAKQGYYSHDELSSFFNKHLHPRAFFKSSMRYNIPGYPSQESSLTLDKDEYRDSILKSEDMVSDYDADVKVSFIKISKDKRKATVKTISHENATIQVPHSGNNQAVPLTGKSTCDQILMINANDVIQIYSANCKTVMSFNSPF
jgi:hypothetical protein